MAYTPDPTDVTRPIGTDPAGSADEEFRALKGYIATLLGFPAGFNPFRKNVMDNAELRIWQKGVSFVSPVNGAALADRYYWGSAGTGATYTVTRSTDVPTVAEAGRKFNYSMQAECTGADAALGAGDLVFIEQNVEGYRALSVLERVATFSVWVKATLPGVYCATFRNSGRDRTYVSEMTVNAANTWEKKTFTLPASPSAGTWNYLDGAGLRVAFVLMCGATFQTPAGIWTAGGPFAASANQVNASATVANKFLFTTPQLEPSNVASEFEVITVTEDFLECQRYLRAWGGVGGFDIFPFMAMCTTTSGGEIEVPLVPRMRAVPTMAISAAADWTVNDGAGAGAFNSFVLSGAVNNSVDGVSMVWGLPAPAVTAGRPGRVNASATANARIYLSAELF